MASSAKRDAATEAAKAQDRADASAARTPPNPTIAVHLTPYAPGCRELRLEDPKRWKTFRGRPRASVVRSTLERVRLAPGAARAVLEGREDVCLMGPVPAEVVAQTEGLGVGEMVPFAIFYDGLTVADLIAEIAALRAADWRPQRLTGAR